MCRPAKKPKPLAGESFLPLKVNVETFQFDAVKRDVDSIASLIELLDDSCALPASPTSSTSSCDTGDVAEVSVGVQTTCEAESRPKTFVYTTFEMASNVENAAAVGFTEDGTALEIRDATILSENVLPKYFRHKNVTSFYRQLNSHGFRTTRSISMDIAHTFSHEMFRRGRDDLLSAIVRKKKDKSEKDAKASKRAMEVTDAAPSISMGSPSLWSVSDGSCGMSPPTVQVVVTPPVDAEYQKGIKMVEELQQSLRMAQTRELVLKARNLELADNNKILSLEKDFANRTMNQLIEGHTALIEKLYGREASAAYTEQMGFSACKEEKVKAVAAPILQIPTLDLTRVGGETNRFVFEDEDLQLLENIFDGSSSSDIPLVL